ncbi:hypothetical protein [Nonomuraea cavernae]|uniref:HEAT repeat domain-containing protein n=1 Tax=Nonomuraea cavernae TaxID=2045107 RepID=A0A917Z7W9_9ACTN|nr:hypothetical protein [Nonomuraea cavernae]MCA2189399.1 hypothetical protein [Nonomuraea cavernae]GGO76891.1 hypothetical protein GCM10012289_55260 [Nonomuraea cavernae]
MNVADERWALDHPHALFDHASRLHASAPDLPPPDGGCRCPNQDDEPVEWAPDSTSSSLGRLLARLEAFATDPDRSLASLHDDIRDLRAPLWVLDHLKPDDLSWLSGDLAHETGIWLVRHGTHHLPTRVGLHLLAGRATLPDVEPIRILGLLSCLGPTAVDVLETIPAVTAELIWLADRASPLTRARATAAMCRIGDPIALGWLLRHAADGHHPTGSEAVRIAEAVSLADVLEEGTTIDNEIVLTAARLLQGLCSADGYPARPDEYQDACRAIAAFAVHAAGARPEPDLLAALITLAEELRSGPAALLPWPTGESAATLTRLDRLIASPRWVPVLAEARRSADRTTRWRAGWAARALSRPFPDLASPDDAHDRLAIRVAVPDPVRSGQVETRLLVNHRPVIAAAFRKGPPYEPAQLPGALEATDRPHEARLAEAYCTEGCCGALYVTIVRDGDTVIWHNWRDPDGTVTLPLFRFHAAQYAETVAQAVRDHGWEWPARSLARRLDRRLRDEPEALATWQCDLGGVFAGTAKQDTVRMTFWYPGHPSSRGGAPSAVVGDRRREPREDFLSRHDLWCSWGGLRGGLCIDP